MIGSLTRVENYRLLDIDRDGIICRLSHQSLRLTLKVGQHYTTGVEAFWDVMALDRFQHRRYALHHSGQAVIRDRHIFVNTQGMLTLHRSIIRLDANSHIVQLCEDLPIGPASLRHQLAAEIAPTIMAISQDESPTCIVDRRGIVLWWPPVLETMTGHHQEQVLGQLPPVAFPWGEPVFPVEMGAVEYQDVAIQCGRLAPALLTARWIGMGLTQAWTLERRRVQIPVAVDLRRRPLVRLPARVITLPMRVGKWLTATPFAADLLMDVIHTALHYCCAA